MSARDELTDFIGDLLHKAGVLDSLMDEEQTTPVHRKVDGLLNAASAENRAEVLAEGLTESERTFLNFALDLAADVMASRGDEFTVEDDAALTSLRAMATSTPAPAPVESAGDETGEAERLREELAELKRQNDELYSKADFWREGYPLAKGYTDDELNARVAIDEATTPHLPPCRFPSSPDCTCTAEVAS